jgi:hypothetical protein
MERLAHHAAINPINRDVLRFLQHQARPGTPAYAGYDLDEYELHAHPDLLERLAEAGAALDARLVAAYGVPLLVHRNGVIFALAYGTSAVLLRLPMRLQTGVITSRWAYRLGAEWIAADAWLSDVPRRDGTERLREWCHWAFQHAQQLGGGRKQPT